MMTEQAARERAERFVLAYGGDWDALVLLLLATDREARDEVRVLRQALERIVDGVPASEPGGGLFIEHRDENGEYIGSEQVDPIAVISCIVGIAASALAARGEVEG